MFLKFNGTRLAFACLAVLALAACQSTDLGESAKPSPASRTQASSKNLNSSLSQNPETASGYFSVRHDYNQKTLGQCRFKTDQSLFVGIMKRYYFKPGVTVTNEDAGLFRLFADPAFKCASGGYFSGAGKLRFIYTATVNGKRMARFMQVEGEAVGGKFTKVVRVDSRDKEWGKSGVIGTWDTYLDLSGSQIREVSSKEASQISGGPGGASWSSALEARKKQLRLNEGSSQSGWFDVKSDLDATGERKISAGSGLVSNRSTALDALITYDISPSSLGLKNLTANSYTLTIDFEAKFEMELVNAGIMGAMVGYNNKKTVSTTVTVTKANGYRASGAVPLGPVDVGGDKQMLLIGARDRLKSFTIISNVKSVK